MARTLYCNLCEEPITFNDNHVSEKTGKKIPLDFDTYEPHNCIAWQQRQQELRKNQRRYLLCKKGCGQHIYFDKDNEYGMSETGKWVPLDKYTEQPHQCNADK